VVVSNKPSNLALDELKGSLVVNILVVGLQVSAYMQGPSHQVAEILWDLRQRVVLFEKTGHVLAKYEFDARHPVLIPKGKPDAARWEPTIVQLHYELFQLFF
jgi:hypothetical protein